MSLRDCFAHFTRDEVLDDGWRCPECGLSARCTKKIDLWKLPPLLVIQLKKYDALEQSAALGRRPKAKTMVSFPVAALDLGEFGPNGQGAVYDLFAVSVKYF